MSNTCDCPQCGRKLQVPENMVGKTARCPFCQAAFTVPGEQVYEAEEMPAPRPDSPGGGAPSEPTYSFELERQAPSRPEADLGPLGSEEGDRRRPCPMCGEMIVADAVKCRFCGEIFDPELKRVEERSRRKRSGTPSDEELTAGEIVAAVLCSGIACIIGVIWMIQGKPKGTKMFIIAMIFSVIWTAIRLAIESSQGKF